MPKSKLAKHSVSSSTQQYLDIAEIKENTVIMRDSTMRAVIMVSSINFALKRRKTKRYYLFLCQFFE
jgi:hypothetical protein